MRGNKFEKSHIHIMESETLSRESRFTESTHEIVESIPYNAHNRPMSTICQDFDTLCREERRRIERMVMSKYLIGSLIGCFR